jgi:inosose dehydratase
MMTVRIGVSPLSWTNDDMPELGGGTSVETCLSEARRIGYAGVELGHKLPRDPRALRSLLTRFDLALVSGWYGAHLLERSPDDELADMQQHLTLLEALGCDVVVFAEVTGCVHSDRNTPLGNRPTLDASAFGRLGVALRAVARAVADRGMRLAYHHHVGTVIETPEDVERLFDACGDEPALLLDTGHLAAAGADPGDAARRWAGRVAHVHLKDVRRSVLEDARSRDSSFLDAVLAGVFTVPGDGDVEYGPVLEALAGAGYDGWLVVEAEQDPRKADPVVYAGRGFETVRALAANAGLL